MVESPLASRVWILPRATVASRRGETELERRVGGRHLEPFELRRGHRRRTHLARACAGDIFIRALRTNPGMCLPCFFAASCALNVIVIVVRHAQHGQLSTVLRELSTPCERATTFRAREEWNTFYSSQGAERLRSGSPIQCMPYITTTVLRNVPTAHCHANTMRNAGPHRVE